MAYIQPSDEDMSKFTTVEVGDRIKFPEEKISYKVIARDERFIIATKPHNPRRIYQYTILDLQEARRGPDNSVFGPVYDWDDPIECVLGLKDLQAGKWEVSHKRGLPLYLDKIIKNKGISNEKRKEISTI